MKKYYDFEIDGFITTCEKMLVETPIRVQMTIEGDVKTVSIGNNEVQFTFAFTPVLDKLNEE